MGRLTEKNKHGQALGRKGLDTRRRLLTAARRLLKKQSPFALTAVSIAREAKTSSAAFYIYFEDTRELLFALCEIAEADMATVHRILDEPWDAGRFELEHASRVVKAFAAVWDNHREVLRYRNLEADRGDMQFEETRLRLGLRLVKRFAAHIGKAHSMTPGFTAQEAMAEASVLVSAMERCAAYDPERVERGVGVDLMYEALARIIAWTVSGPPHKARAPDRVRRRSSKNEK